MKNRAMLLCIKHNIETVEEYALRIGVSTSRAEAIIKEKAILTQEEIETNCRLFNVSADYFLALVE
jgi:plasmid maintenance system antidote protein VapI